MVELLTSLLEQRRPGWDQKAIHEIIKLYGGTEKFVHHHLELLARAHATDSWKG
jgi:hypothetical protein